MIVEINEDYAVGSIPGTRWFCRVLALGERGRVQVLPITEQGRDAGRPFWTVDSLITGTLAEELQFIRRRNERLAEPTRAERIGAAFRGLKNGPLDLGDDIIGQLGGRGRVTLTASSVFDIADRISKLSRGISLDH